MYRNLVVNTISSSVLVPRHLRWFLLRAYGAQIGRSSIAADCFFGDNNLEIGTSAYVNRGVFFDGSAKITIGDKVHIGMNAAILTSGHDLGPSECRAGALVSSPVSIEPGCWIGAYAVIMPGVTVRKGTVIATGSVVTGDCDPDSVYAGVPAKKIRALSQN